MLGLLLAAGAGRRFGGPKALASDDRGVPFVSRTLGVLFDGGCDQVVVVLGAEAAAARALLDRDGWATNPAVDVVVADDWADGMGASLRAGLRCAEATAHASALVMLVDLPDVGVLVVRRVVEGLPVSDPDVLGRATYDGRPGHPVVIGRNHWPGAALAANGDHGARDYLTSTKTALLECGDLATGHDLDTYLPPRRR